MMNRPQVHTHEANPEVLNAIVKASETYDIVASQDIVDVRGLKLWGKGQPVSSALQQRLLDRKLMHPLEACLEVEDGVSLFMLHDDLHAYLNNGTPLSKALSPWAPLLLEQVKQLPLHSVAQLLLTTGLATRPSTLPHAVVAMALAGAMAAARGTAVDVRTAMLGGLLHDIGEAYIQPQYLDVVGPLDLVGHKHLVVHPRVTQMLLSNTTDYPAVLCRAIGEHHERLDGSGYPARLIESALSPLGRLLAVVEVTLGILRSPPAPLLRADFALRVVPGEFDPHWTSFICNVARAAGEAIPEYASPVDAHSSPLDLIDQRIAQAQQLAATLQSQGRGGPILDVVATAQFRLGRLRVAWNALGFWGVDSGSLSAKEQFDLELAGKELQQRLNQHQRECLLLGERLGELEKTWIEPLWRGVLQVRSG